MFSYCHAYLFMLMMNILSLHILEISVYGAILVNIGSGNGLLPDGTKPLPEPMLTIHPSSLGIHLREISQEMPQISIFGEFENY